jgi:CDP-diacylglycerol--glycerol-3-phosphate 3-phosphatidyltransferase
MNLPNWITVSRMLMALPFLLLLEGHGLERIATVIFTIAALTDWLDGYLARRLKLVTDLGKLLDPLVDKVLVTGALVALVSRGVVPAWSVTIVLFREFAVTGMRAAEAQRGVTIAAGWLGKTKAFLQMVALVMLLWMLDPLGGGVRPGWLTTGGMWVYWASVVMAVLSGVQYMWRARSLFAELPTA